MKLSKTKKISIYIILVIAIVGIFAIAIVKSYNPEKENFFIPCIINKLTGIKCPGCGMTRAIHYLVNGNIKQAMWYNLMIIPLIILIIYAFVRYIKYIVKDEEVFNKRMENILKIFLVVIIIFAIIRNFTTLFY